MQEKTENSECSYSSSVRIELTDSDLCAILEKLDYVPLIFVDTFEMLEKKYSSE